MRRSAVFLARCVALALTPVMTAAPTWAEGEINAATPASDAVPPLQIDWKGPDDCDRGAAVRAKVLRLLGSSQRALTTQIKVTVTVRHDKGSRYVAALETATSSGGGTKRLEGESCEAIELASSVVIALSVDPNASLDEEQAPEAPKPPPPPKRVAPPPPPRRVAAKRETFPYLHGSVGVLFRLLNDPSAFTAAGVGVRHRRFSVELGGAVYQPRDVTRADRNKVGAQLRLFTGELLGCYAVLPFQLGAVEACPGARLEYVSASAFGVSNPDQARVLLGSAVGVVRGRLRATSWLSATLDAGAAVRPFHPTFVLIGVGNVFEIPMFSPFARTGLAVEF